MHTKVKMEKYEEKIFNYSDNISSMHKIAFEIVRTIFRFY